MLDLQLSKTALVAAFLCVALGCMSSGNKLTKDQIGQLKRGVTTRSEVEERLGPPNLASIYPEGKRMLSYSYFEHKPDAVAFVPYVNLFAGGGKQKQQQLMILIDQNGIVEDYEFTDADAKLEGGVFNRSRTPEPATPK